MPWSMGLCVREARGWLGCPGCPGTRSALAREQERGPPALRDPQLIPSAHQIISPGRGVLARLSVPWGTERKGGQGKCGRNIQVVVVKCRHHNQSHGGQRPGKLGEVPSGDPEYIAAPIFTVGPSSELVRVPGQPRSICSHLSLCKG